MLQSVEQPETCSGIGGFGERLRRQRELRGISLTEISNATKIGTRLLRAIEKEDLAQLPGGIFNKGYIRAYAKYLGVDEEQAIADYRNAIAEPQLDVQIIAEQNHRARVAMRGPRRHAFRWLPFLIALVVLSGLAGGWHLYHQRQNDRAQAVVASGHPARPPAKAAADANDTSPQQSTNLVPEAVAAEPSPPPQ